MYQPQRTYSGTCLLRLIPQLERIEPGGNRVENPICPAPRQRRILVLSELRVETLRWGVDPRAVQVNPQLLAETVLRGALSLIDTHQRFGGKVTHLDQLNSPEAAEGFLANFLAAFGIQAPPDRATALKFADANAKFLLSFMTKVGQLQPQARSRGSRPSQRRSRSEWRTNSDLFDGAQEMLDQEATGKRGRAGFEPRQRSGRSRFSSNQDIFDEDTLQALNGRL